MLLFSVRVHLVIDYNETLQAELRYLFLRFPLYPQPPKKKKKKDKKKEDKPKEGDKTKEEKSKKESILQKFYKQQGVSAIIELLRAALNALGGLFGRLWRTIVIHDLYINMDIAGNDAAECAIRYGRVCEIVFPLLGQICTKMRVRRYNAHIEPDFLAKKSKATLYCKLSVKPISITNALVILAVQLLVRVLLPLNRGSKSNTEKKKQKNSGEGSVKE